MAAVERAVALRPHAAEVKLAVILVSGAGCSTVPERRPGLLKGIGRRPEDSRNRVARAAFAPVLSADMDMAGRRKVFRHADGVALAAEPHAAVVVIPEAAAMAGVIDLKHECFSGPHDVPGC